MEEVIVGALEGSPSGNKDKVPVWACIPVAIKGVS